MTDRPWSWRDEDPALKPDLYPQEYDDEPDISLDEAAAAISEWRRIRAEVTAGGRHRSEWPLRTGQVFASRWRGGLEWLRVAKVGFERINPW